MQSCFSPDLRRLRGDRVVDIHFFVEPLDCDPVQQAREVAPHDRRQEMAPGQIEGKFHRRLPSHARTKPPSDCHY